MLFKAVGLDVIHQRRENGWQKRFQAELWDIPAFGGLQDEVSLTRDLGLTWRRRAIAPKIN